MVGDRQEGVGVRRQVDAHDRGLLVHDMVDESRVLMGEAVVVLAPDMARQEIVERRDGPSPRDLLRRLEPFRVLVDHRVDDGDERLIGIEDAVATGEEVALQPPLAEMLAQNLHHPALRRQEFVSRQRLGLPDPFGGLEHGAQPVGERLVGTHDPEGRGICLDDVAEEVPEHPRRLDRRHARASRP